MRYFSGNNSDKITITVNNLCALAKTERAVMAHIKAKVDYPAAKSEKGKFLEVSKVQYFRFIKCCGYVKFGSIK